MMAIWDKLSYMIQLIVICLVFMIPARKREHYILRVCVCALLLLAYSLGINSTHISTVGGLVPILYWSHFPILCIPFVYIALDVSWYEALYCVLCACATQHLPYDLYLIYESVLGGNYIVAVTLYILIYTLAYFVFAKNLVSNGRFIVSRKAIFPMTTIIIIVWVLSCLEAFYLTSGEIVPLQRILYRICDGLCCLYVVWVQINQKDNMQLQRELDGINYAWRQQAKQYRVTRDTIDSINRKCHDLKHQIHSLRYIEDEQEKAEYLKEIENDIMIYDTALETGNKALDIVLMEKGLLCKSNQIKWSCMADGSRLDFMKLEDIYALFGNALDNAITAVMKVGNPERRVISVKIITQNNLLMIQIQNYYEGAMKFEGGLPLTTKRNKKEHGFGMKSLRYTAEKYGGTITVSAVNQIFMLQILIPLEDE